MQAAQSHPTESSGTTPSLVGSASCTLITTILFFFFCSTLTKSSLLFTVVVFCCAQTHLLHLVVVPRNTPIESKFTLSDGET